MICSDFEHLRISRSKYDIMGKEKHVNVFFFFLICNELDTNFLFTVNHSHSVTSIL